MKSEKDDNNDTEQSVCSVYTVVYNFSDEDRSWKVAGSGGWSELHVCEDTSDGTYRILAWTHEKQEVLVNVNLNFQCDYKAKSDNFHSFKDEQGVRRGFGFHRSEKNLKNAKEFLEVVRKVVAKLRKNSQKSNSKNRNHSIIQQVPTLTQEERTNPPEKDTSGKLKIHPEWSCAAKNMGADDKIELPTQVALEGSLVMDKKTGDFRPAVGTKLPKGMLEAANMKFGVEPKTLPRIAIDGYKSKIPLLLVQMKERLKDLKGLEEQGIFRLAPDAEECKKIQSMMNKGSDWLNTPCDVNVIANLIKIWFRELPEPILNTVDPAVIELSQTEEKVKKSLQKFSEINSTLLCWLWDFCCELVVFEKKSKMNVQNLGIVMSPNLFNTDHIENPMKAMEFSRKVTTYFQKGVTWRQKVLKERQNSKSKSK